MRRGMWFHWTERKCTSACAERETITPRVSGRPVTGFEYTVNGIAVFDLYVSDKGTYRFKPDQIICPHSSGPMVLNCSGGHSR